MGVERMPGPLGQWILGGLPDFRPGVTSVILSQAAGQSAGEPVPIPTSSEIETDDDKKAGAALKFTAKQKVKLKCWDPNDAPDGEPSREHETTVFDAPEKAALYALKPLIEKYKNEEWGGLIYKVAGSKLYLAGPPVTSGDQAKVDLMTMGFGKGKWRRGDLPGLKTIATYHTHVRGNVDLGGGVISRHYEGIVPPSQIGYVQQLRAELAKEGVDRDRVFEEALKDPTTLGGDVGVAMNSHVDMYVLTRGKGYFHLDWRTLKETPLSIDGAIAPARLPR